MSISTSIPVAGLAEALRLGTRDAHEAAETTTFVSDLMGGLLPIDAYVALLGQLWHVYRHLEATGDALAEDELVGGIVHEELRRLPSIEADLEVLDGPDWRESAVAGPAVQAYVARLDELVAWPAGFVAHHYTRYLGDLAGGQAIRVAVQRTYDLGAGHGTSFFDFPEIPSTKVFRDEYKATLDGLPIDDAERARVVAEAVVAFDHNGNLLRELGQRFPAPAGAHVMADPVVGHAAPGANGATDDGQADA